MSDKTSYLLEQVRSEVRRKDETDMRISSAWVLIPLIYVALTLFIIGLAFVVGPLALLALAGVGIPFGIVFAIVFAVLIYKLVSRRNRHFARQIRMFEYAVQFLREIARAKAVDVEVKLMSVERELREIKDEESEKNAVLWATLTFLTGIAGLYVYYFLTKDFRRHEMREDRILEALDAAITSMGAMPLPRRSVSIPERSFALYLILSIVTLGLFGLYWTYTLIKDPNFHFREQATIEEEIVRRFGQLSG